MDKNSRIFVAGHKGLVGSAIVRRLNHLGYQNLILRSRRETDLTSAEQVNQLFEESKPEYVILAAAKVGGILANSQFPADFIRDNLAIQLNVVQAAHRAKVKKLEFLGSSCIYPKLAPQPLKEEYLLTGPLETSNEWYAIAKIAGIKLCQAYRIQHGLNAISLMPTNLYGPGDNFDLQTSHVLPALIRKFHEAVTANRPEVTIWGSGTPRREFLHVDDLAAAAIFLLENYDDSQIVNVGTGEDISIRDVAELVGSAVGFQGEIKLDLSKPDGTPRKLMDVSRLHAMGWKHRIPLDQGIRDTYAWFLENAVSLVH
jgi:GDP-L-fucose synthase